MLFNSFSFLIFFPIVILVYFIMPVKVKNIWLLAASYYFYMSWNAEYALLILASTVITYACGLLIGRCRGTSPAAWGEASKTEKTAGGSEGPVTAGNGRAAKVVLAAGIIINLGILFYFKYTNFAFKLIGAGLGILHVNVSVPVFDIVLPVGISFYTFQALGYVIDVYRGTVPTERSFLQYALFVSFFPQLVAGPIERTGNLLDQLKKPHKPEYENFRQGIYLMLWGYFLKVVLADRIAVFVDTVYGDPNAYPGLYVAAATVLFGIQIYCDFYGYSTIAVGAARILGIKLMDNFDAPYLAETVEGFWRGWHISLTSWFRDYLYIPLGGNRKGKARKYLNKMIVFLLSGLWHGADLSYVVWGGLNGLYQIAGEVTRPVRRSISERLGIRSENVTNRLFRMLFTFVLVDFSWLFFRAGSISGSVTALKALFGTWNPWIFFNDHMYECGLDRYNFVLMLICIAILLFADICRHRGIVVRDVLLRQDLWFRALFMAAAVCGILLFGVWGAGYDSAGFIYFQF